MSDTEPQRRSVWQRLSLKQLRWTVVAAVLAATAAFGGLQTAHHVTPVSFGEAYNDGPLRITPHGVSVTGYRAGLPELSSQCRFLVLTATIQSKADDSVPFPLAGPVVGRAVDCGPHRPTRDIQMFGLTGVAARFAGAFRGHETIAAPSIEPGFTNDYSLVWVVSRAELSRHPAISIHLYKMSQYVSTFRIDRGWAGDRDHYGELPIVNPESS